MHGRGYIMSRYLTVSIVICDREPIPTYADDLDVLGGRSAIAIVNGGETESGGQSTLS